VASNRHLGRIIVLQSLYEYEFRERAGDPEVDLDLIVAKNIEPYAKALGDTEFVYTLTRDIVENFDNLDQVLRPLAPEWPLETIAAVDRNILRMGLFELAERRDKVPPRVAINEAVELAKAFGSENSSKFVNGVLGSAYRQLGITENPESKDETDEKPDSKKAESESAGGAAKAV